MTSWRNQYVHVNQYSRPGTKLKEVRKLIVHWTANAGGTAANHLTYFDKSLIALNAMLPVKARRFASAHLFVDKTEAICLVPLDEVAFAANDGSFRGVPELRPNANLLSISVELCVEKDGSIHADTIARAIEVFAELCKTYDLDPLADIVRHYDVTHKNCPAPWVADSKQFVNFKQCVADRMKPAPINHEEKGVFDVPLRKGDKGEGVKLLHMNLAALGYTQTKHAEIDTFQEFTEDAVKRFQHDQGMRKPEPGVVDFETASAFAKVLAVFYKERLK